MASWSRRRRASYGALAIILLAVAASVPLYLTFHHTPSCSNGMQDGDELGIDCGGSCTKLCQSAFLAPAVSWARMAEIAPHVYNVAAYIVNPNASAKAAPVPYRMELLDEKGIPLAHAEGTVALPAGRDTLAFQNAIDTGTRAPARAFFEFTAAPVWSPAADMLNVLKVTGKDYSEAGNRSSLSVTLENDSPEPIRDVTVYAILKDGSGNVLDFSRTSVDEIAPAGTALAPFTWPSAHGGSVVSIDVLLVAE